ncbi:MAG: DUF4423 domain-containing protein [Bdellovibrionales bacterium]|nr:DUF4423 domain-containing protein [Bdellovibrionales bacterium]
MKSDASQIPFVELLKLEYSARCKKNRQYSLRAFAKDLKVESSWLSKVLRHQKNPSPALIEKIGDRLGLKFSEIQHYALKSKTGAKSRPTASKPLSEYKVLSEDVLEVLSDWTHFAILELMKINDFENNEKWIAERLGMNFIDARNSIDRLIRVGILQVTPSGQWIDLSGGFTTHNLGINSTSAARRRLQASLLDVSKEKLSKLPITERDHSSVMMASSKEKLNQAKEMIDRFRKELSDFLEDGNQKDTLYQLQVGLFPLDGY